MDKDKMEALDWFVGFSEMDLENIKPGDRAKLEVEARDYLWPQKEWEEIGYPDEMQLTNYARGLRSRGNTPDVVEAEINRAREDNQAFAKDMAWVYEGIPDDSEQIWKTIVDMQPIVRGALGNILGRGGALRLRWAESVMFFVKREIGQGFSVSMFPLAKSQKYYLTLKIYMFADGLPTSAIQQCPGCGKIFLNPSLREKKFCSPKCMWKVNAAKAREKAPEKYRARQRDIMRKKYDQDLIDKYGPKDAKQKQRRRKED